MAFQRQFNMQTHRFSLILVHVGVGQRCRARVSDVESSAPLPTMSTRNVPGALDHGTLRYGFDLSRKLTPLAKLL